MSISSATCPGDRTSVPGVARGLGRAVLVGLAFGVVGIFFLCQGLLLSEVRRHPQPDIDPVRIIELIQRDRAYRLDGSDKLKIIKDLPDAESRFTELDALLTHFQRQHAA